MMISTTKRLLINEWITSTDDSLREMSFGDSAVETIFEFLDNPDTDLELFKAITKKLYELYQTGDSRLRLHTLTFVPALIAIYIRFAHNYYQTDKTKFSSLVVLLLAVYNCEIMEPSPDAVDTGRLKTIDIRVISLTKPSIYHEPNQHNQSNSNVTVPTEQVLARINNPTESRISIFGPYEEVEQLLSSNYMSVCTVLLKVYNHHISELGASSHSSLCTMFLRLLKQGTNIDIKEKIREYLNETTITGHHLKSAGGLILPRNSVQIQFSDQFLVELTKSVYYCIYNDLTEVGFEVLDQIATRATVKLYGNVLLMVNAIKNSLTIKNDRDRNIEGTPEAAVNANKAHNATSMSSLNSFTSGESKWTNVRRTAITTASFKTRKLPDDIPIVPGNAPNAPGVVPAAGSTAGPPALATKSTSSIGSNQNNAAGSTPPTPPANHHNSHLMLQNSKNLDSIDEESTERLLANGDSASGKGGAAKKSGKKNPVMNLFKELKDSKPKLPKMGSSGGGSTKENGKVQHSLLSNNSSSNSTKAEHPHQHSHHSRDRDSDASGLSDGTAKMSIGSEEAAEVMIPMRRLNSTKYIDDELADELADEEGDDRDEVDSTADGALDTGDFNGAGDGQQQGLQQLRDDDEGSSDRSAASSSKGLLAPSKKPSIEGKQQQQAAGLKLSV